MKDIKWLDGNRIQIEPPKRTKKITATRFATVLGLNPWATDFEIWCAVTKTYEKPFEDTIYTIAGKTIEPLQIEYMKKYYGMDNLRTPTDIYGANYFRKTRGDFFPERKIVGGMFDSILVDEYGVTDSVLEFKTTKRAEDWGNDIPEYYALQAALYAYLLGVDDVIMVASFLEETDYNNPAEYRPSAENTIAVQFSLAERYPNFAELVEQVEQWWADYVETGISPAYDEKKDAEILKALRTNLLNPDTDIEALVKEGDELKQQIDEVSASIADKEKRLKDITNILKEYAMANFREGDKKVEIKGSRYCWTVAQTAATEIDKAALEADGLLEKYSKTKSSYRVTVKEV